VSERRLRVLQVGKYYPPHMGGIETHLQTLASGLKHEVDLRVVVSSDGRLTIRERPEGFPLTRLGTALHISTAPISPGLGREIRSFDPDIVHIHLPGPAALLQYLQSGHRRALVLSHHSDIVRQRILGAAFSPLLQRALRRASAILVATSRHIETSNVLPAHREKCRIVPYGIHVEDFAQERAAEVAAIRARHGARLVLAVGRQVYYKGFQYLVRAMREVPARLLLIGNGPLRAELEREAHAAGVAERVSFLDEVEDVRPYYRAAEVFVLPSIARSEAFGIVQLEAMASAVPVVNTRIDSGAPFVSLDGETGMTVSPGDPAGLAFAVNALLADPGLRERYGAAGVRRVRSEFSFERMIGGTMAVYREVAGP
jgi:rhamnosyl/mannosyltransferase